MMLKVNKTEENEMLKVMRNKINTVTFCNPEVLQVEYNGVNCVMTPCVTYNFAFKTNQGEFVLGYDGTYEEWVSDYEYVSSEMYLIHMDGKIYVVGEDGTEYGYLVDSEFLYETNKPKI